MQADLSLSPGINLLVGENGAGKTALLEAAHLLARGDISNTSAKQLIRHNEKELLVRGEVSVGAMRHSLARSKSSTAGSEARIDGQQASRQSRYAELLPCRRYYGHADLVLDGPSIRREFVDWGLFHVEQHYLATAQRFRKALTQRTACLKDSLYEDFSVDPWVTTLAAAGTEISVWRHRFVDALNSQFQQTLKRLQADFACDLRYEGSGFSPRGSVGGSCHVLIGTNGMLLPMLGHIGRMWTYELTVFPPEQLCLGAKPSSSPVQ